MSPTGTESGAAAVVEQVCWCFSYSRAEIASEIARGGRSMIRERIRRETRAGACACARLNPSGRCCLPEVDRIVAQALRERGSEDEA